MFGSCFAATCDRVERLTRGSAARQSGPAELRLRTGDGPAGRRVSAVRRVGESARVPEEARSHATGLHARHRAELDAPASC